MHFAGPVTILNWSFPRKDITRQAQAFQLALAIREEVADLEKAGCRVIQVLLHPHSFTLVDIKQAKSALQGSQAKTTARHQFVSWCLYTLVTTCMLLSLHLIFACQHHMAW